MPYPSHLKYSIDERPLYGFIAQEVMKSEIIVVPLVEFQCLLQQTPAKAAVLDKYGLLQETFISHLVAGFNELSDSQMCRVFLEQLVNRVGLSYLPYEEVAADLDVMEELAQVFARSIDHFLLDRGISSTRADHRLHLIRMMGPQAAAIRILPNTSD